MKVSKHLLRIVVPAALAAAVLCWQATSHGKPSKEVSEADTGQLVVHEWGTFTSFSGSDGVKLEFRPLVDNDLPPFVSDRSRHAGTPRPGMKLSYRVLQRMETPVTYFYTDRPREVNVRVNFPKGLLTEFYPPVATMAPAFDWKKPAPVGNSTLDWGRVLLIPEDRFGVNIEDPKLAKRMRDAMFAKLLPQGKRENHYEYARETDSALVFVNRDADSKRPLAPRGDFFEKFLFYRGVGNFDLPLELQALGEDRFELTNNGKDEIRALFLVSIEGKQIRFSKTDRVAGGRKIILEQDASAKSIGELSEQVVAALMEEGLYEKEARSMVKTWSSSWFGEPGVRLFYILPHAMTEELLPLKVEPTPAETVRVLVGRLEIMSPEDEARATKIVAQSAKTRAAHRKAKIKGGYPIPQEVLKLGRLCEPALIRIKNIAKDHTVRNEAARLLLSVEAYRNAQAKAAAALSSAG